MDYEDRKRRDHEDVDRGGMIMTGRGGSRRMWSGGGRTRTGSGWGQEEVVRRREDEEMTMRGMMWNKIEASGRMRRGRWGVMGGIRSKEAA